MTIELALDQSVISLKDFDIFVIELLIGEHLIPLSFIIAWSDVAYNQDLLSILLSFLKFCCDKLKLASNIDACHFLGVLVSVIVKHGVDDNYFVSSGHGSVITTFSKCNQLLRTQDIDKLVSNFRQPL